MATWRAALVVVMVSWAGVARGQAGDIGTAQAWRSYAIRRSDGSSRVVWDERELIWSERYRAIRHFLPRLTVGRRTYDAMGSPDDAFEISRRGGRRVLMAYAQMAAADAKRTGLSDVWAAAKFFDTLANPRLSRLSSDRLFLQLLAEAEQISEREAANTERDPLRLVKRELRDLQVTRKSRVWEVEIEVVPMGAPPDPPPNDAPRDPGMDKPQPTAPDPPRPQDPEDQLGDRPPGGAPDVP